MLTIKQLASLAGASYAQVLYLQQIGMITPSKPAPRRGMHAFYSDEDVPVVKFALSVISERKKFLLRKLV